MNRIITLDEKNKIEFSYDVRNHLWLYVKMIFLDGNGEMIYFKDKSDYKNFIFDTGAQNTIISKKRANECGYLNLPVQDIVTAGGIGGGSLRCIRIKIPDIAITKTLIIDNPSVLVPDDYSINVNILGQDILKLHSYYLDAKRQYIYFDLN
jgi:hypothetical protein